MDRKTESVSRPDGKKGVRAGRIYIRYAAAFGILTGLLLILTVWNINSGSIHISVRDILQILFQRQGEDAAYNIVWGNTAAEDSGGVDPGRRTVSIRVSCCRHFLTIQLQDLLFLEFHQEQSLSFRWL